LEQVTKGQGLLENFLVSLRVPKLLQHEVALLLSGLMFAGMYSIEQNRNTFAQCYYNWGEEAVNAAFNNNNSIKPENQALCIPLSLFSPKPPNKDPSAKMLSSAEANFNRATALNPDYPEAYFLLGKIYELSQDLDKARTQYRLAIQNGSLKARSRLAWLYLIDSKTQSTDTATAILIQGLHDIEQLKKDTEDLEKNIEELRKKSVQDPKRSDQLRAQLIDALDSQLDWYLAIALARSRQKRENEALNYLNDAEVVRKKAEKTNTVSNFFYCIQAEILDKNQRTIKQDIYKIWKFCQDTNFLDPVKDFWRTKTNERLHRHLLKEKQKP
jgi:TPR repeat